MKTCNIEEKKSHKERVCSLHGVCGKEPLVFASHEITLYGLQLLSGHKSK